MGLTARRSPEKRAQIIRLKPCLRSNGTKTPECKKASMNALKHGVRSQEMIELRKEMAKIARVEHQVRSFKRRWPQDSGIKPYRGKIKKENKSLIFKNNNQQFCNSAVHMRLRANEGRVEKEQL